MEPRNEYGMPVKTEKLIAKNVGLIKVFTGKPIEELVEDANKFCLSKAVYQKENEYQSQPYVYLASDCKTVFVQYYVTLEK